MSRQRKYSIEEIDRMRSSVADMFGLGPYRPAERAAEVEQRLRTYMLNGTTPEELAQVSQARQEADWRMFEQMQAAHAQANQTKVVPRS